MSGSSRFPIGAKLRQKQDGPLTAEILDTRVFHGIEHYQIRISPSCFGGSPVWLSVHAVRREYEDFASRSAAPRSGVRGVLSRLGVAYA